MEAIKKQYLMNEKNEATAVLLDLETFEKIETILEDYGLAKLMDETLEKSDSISLKDAKVYYASLDRDN